MKPQPALYWLVTGGSLAILAVLGFVDHVYVLGVVCMIAALPCWVGAWRLRKMRMRGDEPRD